MGETSLHNIEIEEMMETEIKQQQYKNILVMPDFEEENYNNQAKMRCQSFSSYSTTDCLLQQQQSQKSSEKYGKNSSVEERINSWLDSLGVQIADPNCKREMYYQEKRYNLFNSQRVMKTSSFYNRNNNNINMNNFDEKEEQEDDFLEENNENENNENIITSLKILPIQQKSIKKIRKGSQNLICSHNNLNNTHEHNNNIHLSNNNFSQQQQFSNLNNNNNNNSLSQNFQGHSSSNGGSFRKLSAEVSLSSNDLLFRRKKQLSLQIKKSSYM